MTGPMQNQKTDEILEAPPSVFANVFQPSIKPKPILEIRPTFSGYRPDGVTIKLTIPIK